jgi:hypothetical protein
MKQKDGGNRQRYDPVSKRMITTYPEIPTISDVTLTISEPVFISDPLSRYSSVFRSDYTVSFRGYSGCLNFGSYVICAVYDHTGAQILTKSAKIINGINAVVLNGPYTPGGYVYYASVQYGLSTFNSVPTQLLPELPVLSNVSASINAKLIFGEANSITWSYDNEFVWQGQLTIDFVSYEIVDSTATYTITNITNPDDQYDLVSASDIPVTYGLNSTQLLFTGIIRIPTGTGRTSLPYNSLETLSCVITHKGETYSLPNFNVSPTLIQGVILTFTDTFWILSKLYAQYSLEYRLQDGSLSAFRNPGVLNPFRTGQKIIVNALGIDDSVTQLNGNDDFLEGGAGLLDRRGAYTYSGEIELPLNPQERSYYGSVEYSHPSFDDALTQTVNSSNINYLRPELSSPPMITSITNIRTRSTAPFGLIANFTVSFNYQPRTTARTSLKLQTVGVFSGSPETTKNVTVGQNIIEITDIPVVTGDSFILGVYTKDTVASVSEAFECPSYSNLSFTSVPTTVSTYAGGAIVPTFSITISWNNVISGYTGQSMTIATVGLTDSASSAEDTSITYTPSGSGIASITFNMNTATLSGNSIEHNLAKSVQESGGFADLRFKLTDSSLTQASILSSIITCNR